jgi:hypothetical protein
MWRQQRRWTIITENLSPSPNFKLQVLKRKHEVHLCLTGTCNRNWVGVTNLYWGKFNTVLIKVLMGQIIIHFIFALGPMKTVGNHSKDKVQHSQHSKNLKSRNENMFIIEENRLKNTKPKYHWIWCYCWYNLSQKFPKHKHTYLWKHEHG